MLDFERFFPERERGEMPNTQFFMHTATATVPHTAQSGFMFIFIFLSIYRLDNIRYMYLFTSGDNHVNNYTET